MEKLLLSLGLYHSSEIKSPKVALSRLKSPKVALSRLKSQCFFGQFRLSRLKSPKVALSYGDLRSQSRPYRAVYKLNANSFHAVVTLQVP